MYGFSFFARSIWNRARRDHMFRPFKAFFRAGYISSVQVTKPLQGVNFQTLLTFIHCSYLGLTLIVFIFDVLVSMVTLKTKNTKKQQIRTMLHISWCTRNL